MCGYIRNNHVNYLQEGDTMPNWMKWTLFVIAVFYMMINEGARIETRKELDKQILIHKSWAEEFSYRLREHKNIYTKHEHFYNGPPKPSLSYRKIYDSR